MEGFLAVFGIQFIWGLAGTIVVSRELWRLPAERGIDSPFAFRRWLYRLSFIGAFNFLSWGMTLSLMRVMDFSIKEWAEPAQLAFFALAPFPLTAILYLLYRAYARWLND